MLDDESYRLATMGAVVLRAAGQGVRLVGGLIVVAFGLGMAFVTVMALALPDVELIKAYVRLVAGGTIEMKGEAVPLLAPVVIGVRLVLVACLLMIVGLVNEGWKWCRSVLSEARAGQW